MSTTGENIVEYSAKTCLAIALSVVVAISSACFPVCFILGNLLFPEFTNNASTSGFSPAILLISGGIMSYYAGKYKGNIGYKSLLSLACIGGLFGSGLLIYSIAIGNAVILAVSLFFIGGSHGTIFLSRYAITEVTQDLEKGRAISKVIMWSTIGAISGPFIINIGNEIGNYFAFNANIFPMFLLIVLYIAGLISVRTLIDNRLFTHTPNKVSPSKCKFSLSLLPLLGGNMRLLTSMLTMNLAHFLMLLIMSITPIYMHTHDHTMLEISLVMSAHFVGMYGFAYISGVMVDKKGPAFVANIGLVILAITGSFGFFTPNTYIITTGLLLLGIGWNMCFVSGSTMISIESKAHTHLNVQGSNEIILYIVAFSASILSGILLKHYHFTVLLILSDVVIVAFMLFATMTLKWLTHTAQR